MGSTTGVGLTVIVNDCGDPGQLAFPPAKLGETVIVALTGFVVALVVVKDEIFPVPEAANPTDGLLLVHA